MVLLIIVAGCKLPPEPLQESPEAAADTSPAPKQLLVGPSEQFHSIQEAVDGASTGDTVVVRAGEYNETVKISRSISLIAEGKVMLRPIDAHQPAILVTADNVVIKGFIIENVKSESGIFLDEINGCIVEDNSVNFNSWGIVVYASSNCKITNNSARNNTGFYAKEGEVSPSSRIKVPSSGIQLIHSKNNVLHHNYLLDNSNGIDLAQSTENTISENLVERSALSREHSRYNNGIGLFDGSHSNILINNTVANYQDCIDLAKSSNNKIIGNIASNCGGAIGLNHNSNHAVVNKNTVKDSGQGILLWDSNTNATISDNEITNNDRGISFYNSNGNIIQGCTMKDNLIDIYSLNSKNKVVGCEFASYEGDTNSSLDTDEV